MFGSKAAIYGKKPFIYSKASTWLDAVSIEGKVNDDPINPWGDRSSQNTSVTQADPSRQALYQTNVINGLPALKLDGFGDYYVADSLGSIGFGDGYTEFVVIQPGTGLTTTGMISAWNYDSGSTNGDLLNMEDSPPNRIRIFIGADSTGIIIKDVDLAGVPTLVTVVRNNTGGVSKIYVNGVLEVSSVFATDPGGASPRFSIGSEYDAGDSPGNYYKGLIGELILFPEQLSDTQRVSIENYLMPKWGI